MDCIPRCRRGSAKLVDGKPDRVAPPAVGTDKDVEVAGFTDPFQIVIVVGQFVCSDGEIHLRGLSCRYMHLLESLELLHRAGGGRIDVNGQGKGVLSETWGCHRRISFGSIRDRSEGVWNIRD